MIGDTLVTPLSITATQITAVTPATLASAVAVTVQSGGATSNQVLAPTAAASPGIFSADGTGVGQGYIFNQNGTPNTPANQPPPASRSRSTRPVSEPFSFTDDYAVTASPVAVFIDGFYCNGVAAHMGPVAGLPGNIYKLTVFVPDPANPHRQQSGLEEFHIPSAGRNHPSNRRRHQPERPLHFHRYKIMRSLVALLAICQFCSAQNFPALRWVKQLDNLGTDTLLGMSTDAQGNIYVVGSTTSTNFPVKNAVQSQSPRREFFKSTALAIRVSPKI